MTHILSAYQTIGHYYDFLGESLLIIQLERQVE